MSLEQRGLDLLTPRQIGNRLRHLSDTVIRSRRSLELAHAQHDIAGRISPYCCKECISLGRKVGKVNKSEAAEMNLYRFDSLIVNQSLAE